MEEISQDTRDHLERIILVVSNITLLGLQSHNWKCVTRLVSYFLGVSNIAMLLAILIARTNNEKQNVAIL